MRSKKIKLFGIVLAAVLLLGSVTPVMAAEFRERKEIGAHWMMLDALVVRPLSAVEVVLGTGLWLLSMPTIGSTQSADNFTRAYIENPFTFGFDRPTGDFGY